MKPLTLLLCYLIYLLFQSPPALATTQEVYRFERLWPLLSQPWHFGGVWNLAISPQGYLYAVEYGTFRIQKFDLEGHYITEFGKLGGPQDKHQWLPRHVAIDSHENAYVAYSHRLRGEDSSPDNSQHLEDMIRKFDAYGNEVDFEGWTTFNQTLLSSPEDGIRGIVIDRQDNVYLLRSSPLLPHQILHKLTPDGELLDQWPVEVDGVAMAIGTHHIYIIARSVNLVSKYTLEGTLVKTWGGTGDQPGNFIHINDLAVDSQDNVYVVDSELPSIQKFTSDGQLLVRWLEPPPAGLEETLTHSPLVLFQQFIKLGGLQLPAYLNYWLTFDWQQSLKLLNFNPSSIAVDSQDNIYVGFDVPNDSIRKYTPDFRLLNQWADGGNNSERLHFPMDIIRDRHGNLYIADMLNQRIVKLDATGQWVKSWGKLGNGPGEFLAPLTLAIDQEDNVYVVDAGTLRIQKFTADGDFITQWGELSCEIPGLVRFYCSWLVLTGEQSSCSPALIQQAEELTCSNEPGNFYLPTGIATDQHNNVYVVDSLQKVIHKFSSKGKFLTTWENAGENAGEFGQPLTIKVDNHDNVYITDVDQHNIKKFTTTGKFIKQWGTQGRDEGQLQYPTTLATDEMGNIYVYDGDNYRIQKFTTEGDFVTQWGEFGSNPGQLGSQGALAVTPDGNQVYFIDLFSNRLQIFNKTLYDVGKAIIVAGGRGKDDSLWDATQMVSNFAYQALLYQGFTKDTIYYLNAITNLDLDNNGEYDDVDATSTKVNLQYAITQWANDTDNLTLFLTDHGGHENFSFSETEELPASDLSGWLDTWQGEKNGKVKIIYDACQSGSFLPHFVPPAGQNRLVITSATANQSAYFSENGSLSFSFLFWDEILKGVDIGKAFTDASTTVDYLGNQATTQNQTPQLDANGNGEGNEPADLEAVTRQKVFIGNIGNGTVTNSQAPTITAVPPQTLDQPNTPVTITAEVQGVNAVSRVWVVVRSPADLARTETAGTITALPSFELTSVDETHWKGHYQEFDQEGTYFLAIYAYDSQGNTSQPQMTTVQVQNPLRHRALLIGGELPAKVHRVQEAYDALKYQGYTDEDIYYLSNLSSPGVDGSTTVDNVKFALLTWAQANPTQNLIVYVEGVEAQGAVMLNASDALTVEQLDEWLDTLQATLPGPVIVIYQGALSDKIWSVSTPPTSTTRIVMSSTSLREDGCLNPEGWQPIFAEAFWRAVRKGEANLLKVFNTAKQTMMEVTHQEPHYDANGNGIPDEKSDQEETNKVRLGLGIVTAADEPRLGDISPTQVLQGDTTTATIMVHSVNTLDDIQQVTAEIKPPCECQEAPATIELQPNGKGGYEGRYAGFQSDGNYLVIISAVDTHGRKSLPKMTWVQRRLPLIPSQAKYHTGETVQVKLPSPLLDTEEQYLVIKLPDGSSYAIQGRNQFVPLGETVPVWSGTGEEVIDWKVEETLPKGEYWLYLVRVPKGGKLTLPVATELVRETGVVVE